MNMVRGGVTLIANMPTHYRVPVFDRLPAEAYSVIYCSRIEPSRQWNAPELRHRAIFLPENFRSAGNGVDHIHSNREVWEALNGLRPSVVVVCGFNPTHLFAMVWAWLHGAGLVYMTDGTAQSESRLTVSHRFARRALLKFFRGHIVTGSGGRKLLESYGVDPCKVQVSRLCGPPAQKLTNGFSEREFDVMFCGRIQAVKMPLFFAEVCAGIRARRGRCRALVVGDGDLRGELLDVLESEGVEASYAGFLPPAELPSRYASARLLLFPTSYDPWGLVANEALAAGTPVFTTAVAGCAGDLVVDGGNGRVLAPTADLWAEAACELLGSEALWSGFSARALKSVEDFNYESAAAGIRSACERLR